MNTRDLGLNHSPGKGDKSRTKFDDAWRRKFGKLKGMGTEATEKDGYRRVGTKMVKNYG